MEKRRYLVHGTRDLAGAGNPPPPPRATFQAGQRKVEIETPQGVEDSETGNPEKAPPGKTEGESWNKSRAEGVEATLTVGKERSKVQARNT